MSSGTVTALFIHPIKSCRRVEVDSATASTTGLAGDREWQVISGLKPVTQRASPAMAVIRAEPIDGGLRISAPGHTTIEVARPTAADRTSGSLIGAKVDAADAGDAAARWFSAVLDDDVRLVAMAPGESITVPDELDVFEQSIAFNDLSPVLVANTASYDWLVERASEPFPIERFRPNIVVDTDEPFAEDTWSRFRIGAAEFARPVIWPRCAIPQVDQETGERHKEPAVVLRAHRWCTSVPELSDVARSVVENKGIFGIGCAIGPAGAEVAIGDTLAVEERRTPMMPNPDS